MNILQKNGKTNWGKVIIYHSYFYEKPVTQSNHVENPTSL